MATEKQIAANRANAKKSTGPRTPKGKDASARNGPKHRRLMQAVVLESESSTTFRTFQNWFHAEYKPDGPTQTMLLNIMITAAWRLFRLWHLERASIDYELGQQLNPSLTPSYPALDFSIRTHLAVRKLGDQMRPLESWSRAEARLDRQFRTALESLLKLQGRTTPPATEFPLTLDAFARHEEFSRPSNPISAAK